MSVVAQNFKKLTGQGTGEEKEYNLAEMSDLMNDNLLLNSDFARGIINQQGKSSYTYTNKTILTVDGWLSYGVNVAVASYYITVANRDTSPHTLRQPMKHKTNKVTLYLNLKNVTGNSYVYFNGYTDKQQKLVEGEHTYTFDIESGEITVMSFNLEANASFNFLRGKLEDGEYFTGMPPYNYGQQMLLCRRKFKTMVGRVYRYAQKAGKFNGVQFPLVNEYEMDGTPTVKIKDTYKANCTIAKENQFGYIYAQITPIATGNYEVKFEVTIDSNTY